MDRLFVAQRIADRIRVQHAQELRHVTITVKAAPGPLDLDRGATTRHRGYFWGVAPDPVLGTELPDPTPAIGELVVFAGHPAHASELELERTFEHEIGHILGRSEEQLASMGLDA